MAAAPGSAVPGQPAAEPEAITIERLPDHLLAHALGFLHFCERQRIARVSKRFAALCGSPELLREVDVGWLHAAPQAAHSLTAWLTHHRQHVRRLRIAIDVQAFSDNASAAIACLAAAGAAGGLAALIVEGRVPGTDWLAALRSLRHVELKDYSGQLLFISPAINLLTALESLKLAFLRMSFGAGARLPASITRLHLRDKSTDMPQQIAELPQLAQLAFESCGNYSAASLAPLSRLSGCLTRLDLLDVSNVPAALTSLTQLRHLHCDLGFESGGAFHTSLQHLPQLTFLILRSRDLDPPATLASLTNLQRCYLQRRGQRSPGAGAVPPLPGGPWLRGLRWLGANVDTLASSAAVLEEAESLEFVEANESLSTAPFYWRSQPVTVLFAWLARHPSLTQASFHGNCYGGSTPLATLWAPAEHGATWVSAFDSRDFAVHLMQLGRRPGLQLRCSHSALDLTPPMLELMSK